MKQFKITYWNNGDILVKEIEAENKEQSQYLFYMSTPCDDIKSIEAIE